MVFKRPSLSVPVYLFTVICCASSAFGQIRYVDDNAPLGGNGQSWATAYSDFQSALSEAAGAPGTITEIRVAQGVYKPSTPILPTPLYRTFTMLNGVTLNGGY